MENPLSNNPGVTPTTPIDPKTDDTQSARPAIRTLHSDVAASVHDNNISITKIALAQQAKNEGLPFVAEEREHFWSAWSIGTIVLIVAGLIVVGGAIFIAMSKTVSLPFVNQEPPAPTLVPVIKRTTIDTTRMPRAELIKTIEAFTDDDYSSPVALEALIVQEMTSATSSEGEVTTSLTPLPIERFLERLGSRAPGRLVRSIGPDMTIGRAGGTPFIIVSTQSYETAFAGMLEWETLMADDLPFITKELPQPAPIAPVTPVATSTESTSSTTASSTIASSTASTTPTQPPPAPVPPKLTWKDIIVKNKDVRALTSDNGTIVLLYAFPKNGIMVITQSKEAFSLVVDGLNSPVFGM